ncbi:hypothetical protein ACLOJK_029462, partial [Asimina triloba]
MAHLVADDDGFGKNLAALLVNDRDYCRVSWSVTLLLSCYRCRFRGCLLEMGSVGDDNEAVVESGMKI